MNFLTKLKPEPMGVYSASTAYGINSLVMSADGAAAYLSVKDVPAGTPLTNAEYWTVHTDLSAVKQSMEAAEAEAHAAAAEALGTKKDLLAVIRNLTNAVEKTGNPVQAELVGGMPFDEVTTTLEPVQAGSGDPGPDNIRPITGFTGAGLTRCGKNLLKNTATTQTVNGVTVTVNADGSVTANGTATSEVLFHFTASVIPNVYDGMLLSGGLSSELSIAINYFDAKKSWMGVSIDRGSGIVINGEGASYVRVAIRVISGATVNSTVYPMIRLASDTDDTYAPYQGGTFTADFGQTVYGGTLDWNTGVLTVDRAIKAFDGTEAWQTSNYGAYFYLDIDDGIVSSDVDIVKAASSHFKGVAEVDRMNGEPVVYFMSNRSTVEFRNTGHADVTEWKAYLAAQYAAGTPVQIAYKLAAPTTIQLTPQEILALDGVNTLYGDGSISITGRQRADIALISRIEALESA